MAYNVSDVIAAVRRELTETTEREWKDNELLDYLNDCYAKIHDMAVKECSTLVDVFEDVDVDADTSTASLTYVPLKVNGVRYYLARPTTDAPTDGTELTAAMPSEIQFNGQTGTPLKYALEGDTLRIWPQPTETTHLTVWYMKDVSLLAYSVAEGTDSEIPLPVAFRRILKEYVLIRAYNRREMSPEIESAFFKDNMQSIRALLVERTRARHTGVGYYGNAI